MRDRGKALREQSAEEMAQHEHRLILDTKRLSRLPLLKAFGQLVEDGNIEGIRDVWPDVLRVIALWKRCEVQQRVMMKVALRGQAKAEHELLVQRMLMEEYDKDYSALARENEEMRHKK